MIPQSEAQKVLDQSVQRCVGTIAKAVDELTPLVDSNPKGLDAVVLSATLRAFADVIEKGFDEGNTVGPLKQAVDDVRARLLQTFLQVGS